MNKLGLLGANGKMGRSVIKVAQEMGIGLISHSRSFGTDKEVVFIEAEVIIDFSSHEDVQNNILLAEKYNKPILIATTNHAIIPTSSKIPLLYAPNTCLEWLELKKCILQLNSKNPDCSITIDDIHSATKKDCPSGTTKDLIRDLNREVDSRSIRKVEIPSWHKVSLYTAHQVIEIQHQVLDREIYAKGAIQLASELIQVNTV